MNLIEIIQHFLMFQVGIENMAYVIIILGIMIGTLVALILIADHELAIQSTRYEARIDQLMQSQAVAKKTCRCKATRAS